jgi:hypothetical protein
LKHKTSREIQKSVADIKRDNEEKNIVMFHQLVSFTMRFKTKPGFKRAFCSCGAQFWGNDSQLRYLQHYQAKASEVFGAYKRIAIER